jgi:putative transposase
MARAIRIEYPGAVYHITARGNRRARIFDDEADRERFLAFLGAACARFGWILTVYTLLSNHFHLVVSTPRANLGRGMQWLSGSYASWFNRRHGTVGHLFGERYKAILVENERYMQRLARYVVLNPVRAGIVASPGEYRWSSYRATAGLEAAPEWLSVGPLMALFGEPASWRANYIGFVAEGIEKADPIWRGLRRRAILGSEDWLRAMRQRFDGKLRKTDIPLDQRAAARAPMAKIVKTVARAFGVSARELKRGGAGVARSVAAWLGVYEGARRLRVIAHVLGLRSCSRVTQLVAECDRLLRRDRALWRKVQALRPIFA